jgi:hypothetical protein
MVRYNPAQILRGVSELDDLSYPPSITRNISGGLIAIDLAKKGGVHHQNLRRIHQF